MKSACVLVWTLALGACGDRTGLASGDLAQHAASDAPLDAPAGLPCGAPDPAQALTVGATNLRYFGNVAGSGCSFAMIWVEPSGGPVAGVLRAQTAEVVDGEWSLSPTVTVAKVSGEQGTDPITAVVGWDGSAFTVAWGDEGSLFLRRLSKSGTLLDPAERLVGTGLGTGLDGYVLWIDPSPSEGTLGLGLFANPVSTDTEHSGIYFLKVTLEGTAIAPAAGLTSQLPTFGVAGFAHLPGGEHVLMWSPLDDPPVGATLSESFFADDGTPTEPTVPSIVSAEFLQMATQGGVALVGGDTYFGLIEEVDGGAMDTLVGLVGLSGYTPVTGIDPGQSIPALGVTNMGVVGVLSGPGTDLLLSFVARSRVTATVDIAPGEASTEYALATGSASFGVFWATGASSGPPLSFTVKTP
jgi:hypothetical protein